MPGLRVPQSDGESVPGSSCQEEDEESLYRRSQYSPEVEQHELDERGQGSLAELGPVETQKRIHVEKQPNKRGSAAEELSEDPIGDVVHPLQSQGPSEITDKSDSEPGEDVCHNQAGQRQKYSSSSESELDDQELNDFEQRKQQVGGFGDAGERNSS